MSTYSTTTACYLIVLRGAYRTRFASAAVLLRCPAAAAPGEAGLHLADRCHSLGSLLPPPAALPSFPGIEPVRILRPGILSPLCLPIPPFVVPGSLLAASCCVACRPRHTLRPRCICHWQRSGSRPQRLMCPLVLRRTRGILSHIFAPVKHYGLSASDFDHLHRFFNHFDQIRRIVTNERRAAFL